MPPKVGRELSHAGLKKKHREIRDKSPNPISLRIHRSLSWLSRAEQETGDRDAAFIFYWIAFNAAYADDTWSLLNTGERSYFEDFFGKLIGLDSENRIYDEIWNRFPGSIRIILDNKFVFQPFWNHLNGIDGFADWEDRFKRSKRRLHAALRSRKTKLVLTTLFDRLYVLRNQIVHGGATWNGKVNRGQVTDGAEILSFLVPIFIDLMMDNPNVGWGAPFYPVIDDS